MNVTINDLVTYYSAVQPILMDTYWEQYPSAGHLAGDHTNRSGSGLLIPLSGCARYTLNGTSYHLKPGVVLHAGASMNISKKSVGADPWSYMVLHYKIANETSSELRQYHGAHFQISTGVNTQIADMALRLHDGMKTSCELGGLRNKTVLAALIEAIVSSAMRNNADNREQIVDDAIRVIQNRYMEDITIGQLSADYGMNLKQFSSIFRKKVGRSAIDYLTDLRIRRAKDLLLTGVHSVRAVAESVGYSDSYYFSRLFKQRAGVSPSEFMTCRTNMEKIHSL